MANMGMRIPYHIETFGTPIRCHCMYIDNGNISGSMTFRNNEHYTINVHFADQVTIIPCWDGTDTPGFEFRMSATGFTATYNITYNWEGRLICQDEDLHGLKSDSASINEPFFGPAEWPPGRK